MVSKPDNMHYLGDQRSTHLVSFSGGIFYNVIIQRDNGGSYTK